MSTGPFLWLNTSAPPRGFREVPAGGMCLCAFLFVRRGSEILLGRYRNDPAWETLAGLDQSRLDRHSHGWTVPSVHLQFGQDPREAAFHIGAAILQLPGLRYGEPRVYTETYPLAADLPHYDMWFFVEAELAPDAIVQTPPWYDSLAWHDPRTLPASDFARAHEDVVARWRNTTGGPTP